MKLRSALALSLKRASRGDPQFAALLQAAQVQGVDLVLKTKNSTITFKGKPLRGSLHQMYDWKTLDDLSVDEIPHSISWSLDHSLQDERRHARRA